MRNFIENFVYPLSKLVGATGILLFSLILSMVALFPLAYVLIGCGIALLWLVMDSERFPPRRAVAAKILLSTIAAITTVPGFTSCLWSPSVCVDKGDVLSYLSPVLQFWAVLIGLALLPDIVRAIAATIFVPRRRD
ncbi:MAG: hypothetical protein ACK4RV_00905 [Caulobacter sp.]